MIATQRRYAWRRSKRLSSLPAPHRMKYTAFSSVKYAICEGGKRSRARVLHPREERGAAADRASPIASICVVAQAHRTQAAFEGASSHRHQLAHSAAQEAAAPGALRRSGIRTELAPIFVALLSYEPGKVLQKASRQRVLCSPTKASEVPVGPRLRGAWHGGCSKGRARALFDRAQVPGIRSSAEPRAKCTTATPESRQAPSATRREDR